MSRLVGARRTMPPVKDKIPEGDCSAIEARLRAELDGAKLRPFAWLKARQGRSRHPGSVLEEYLDLISAVTSVVVL